MKERRQPIRRGNIRHIPTRSGHVHIHGNKWASTKTKVKKRSVSRPTRDHPPF